MTAAVPEHVRRRPEELPPLFDKAFLGWSVFDPAIHYLCPVYDMDIVVDILRGECGDDAVSPPQKAWKIIYDKYIRAKKDGRTYAPIFISKHHKIDREDLLDGTID